MKKRVVCILVLFMVCALQLAEAEPMLYRVTGEKGTLYLLPTIHLGNEEMASALETRALPVVKSADRLVVEVDDAFLQNPSEALRLSLMIRYDSKEIAANHLSEETYEKALALLKRVGVYNYVMEGCRAQCWPQLCEEAICISSGMRVELGVDRVVMRYARKNGVPIESMETADEQYALLLSTSDALADWLLSEIVSDPDTVIARYAAMPALFISGDKDALLAVSDTDLTGVPAAIEEEAYQYYNALLKARDDRFEEHAIRYLNDGGVTVLMVGALHVIGENGLIDRLQNAGYEVELLK